MTPEVLEHLLSGLEIIRENFDQNPELFERVRGACRLLVSSEALEDKLHAFENGVAVIHPKVYRELRRAAVEQLRLLPFPDDRELALLIYCGCVVVTDIKRGQNGEARSKD